MSPTLLADSPRVLFLLRTAATAPATVISRPSRIHATPSATTIRVWNFDHGSRSMRVGIVQRTTPASCAEATSVVMSTSVGYGLLAALTGGVPNVSTLW